MEKISFHQTQNTVYEIVSDMSTRQDALDERISSLEEKIQIVQVIFNSRLRKSMYVSIVLSLLVRITLNLSPKFWRDV